MPRPGYIQVHRNEETARLLDEGARRLGLEPGARGTDTAVILYALREVFGPTDQSVLRSQLDMATDMLYRLAGPDSAEILRSGLLAPAERVLRDGE